MSRGTYKLIDAIDFRKTIRVARRVKGITYQGSLQLQPRVLYELEDDDLFIKSLKERTETVDYSEAKAATLEQYGIKWTAGTRKCCGGRITKTMSYLLIEVNEFEEKT